MITFIFYLELDKVFFKLSIKYFCVFRKKNDLMIKYENSKVNHNNKSS